MTFFVDIFCTIRGRCCYLRAESHSNDELLVSANMCCNAALYWLLAALGMYLLRSDCPLSDRDLPHLSFAQASDLQIVQGYHCPMLAAKTYRHRIGLEECYVCRRYADMYLYRHRTLSETGTSVPGSGCCDFERSSQIQDRYRQGCAGVALCGNGGWACFGNSLNRACSGTRLAGLRKGGDGKRTGHIPDHYNVDIRRTFYRRSTKTTCASTPGFARTPADHERGKRTGQLSR